MSKIVEDSLLMGRDLTIENFYRPDTEIKLIPRFDFQLKEDEWSAIYVNGGKAFQINRKTGRIKEWNRYD